MLSAGVLVCLVSTSALATANFVYHEQTGNFVATPTCPSSGTDSSCGRYTENTDRSGAAGFQIYSPESYTLHFKIEFQFFTNQLRVYYTTDGSNPSGSMGTPFGTTQVATASYTCTYSDQTQSCQIVDVGTAVIPAQPAGTTVKYIIGAWHSGGGPEVFANSGTCSGCFSCTDSTTGCATPFQYNVVAPPATPLIISEFRWNGTNGPSDEFIEIYNNSDSDVTVNAFDGSAGFAFAKSTGTTLFTIPNGTVIPARGHYLGCNSVAYSQASYPAGNGTTATCDATYSGTDAWPINTGGALFITANPANFTLANRLDAVGATAEANTLYKEGTGVRNLNAFPVAYSYFRRLPGGCIGTNPGTVDSNCTSFNAVGFTGGPTSSYPQDTNDNRADFIFQDTNGTPISSEASQQRLGAPGPENLSSPIVRGGSITTSNIDNCVASSSAPNRVRDLTNDPSEPNDTFGSLFIRRRFTNNTGANVTRLRFRIVDITTFPAAVFSLPPAPNDFCGAPGSQCAADLRALTSTSVVVSISAACGGGTTTVQGTTLEEAATPEHQPNGGGYNSTLSAGTITLATPLANTASVNLQFRLGVQQQGRFRFFVNLEALP
jgi:hypothetical protein